MDTNEKGFALKEASARYAAALAALGTIQAALPAQAAPNDEAVKQARLKLEDCIASRALNEATAEDEAQAREELEHAEKTLAAEQATFEAARLKLDGLNRRLVVAQQAEAEAKQALSDVEVEWLREEMRIADEAYTKQSDEIHQSYLRVSACVNALKSRGVAASHFSTSEELAIPAIGPVSCDSAWHKRGGQSGHGKLLVDAHRRNINQPANDDVERDLEQAKSVSKASKPSRFAKVVAGLIPGTQG